MNAAGAADVAPEGTPEVTVEALEVWSDADCFCVQNLSAKGLSIFLRRVLNQSFNDNILPYQRDKLL